MVLATLKRAPNELSSYQQKVFKIDDHMGIAMAGTNRHGRKPTQAHPDSVSGSTSCVPAPDSQGYPFCASRLLPEPYSHALTDVVC